jgi:hypothetical protein
LHSLCTALSASAQLPDALALQALRFCLAHAQLKETASTQSAVIAANTRHMMILVGLIFLLLFSVNKQVKKAGSEINAQGKHKYK